MLPPIPFKSCCIENMHDQLIMVHVNIPYIDRILENSYIVNCHVGYMICLITHHDWLLRPSLHIHVLSRNVMYMDIYIYLVARVDLVSEVLWIVMSYFNYRPYIPNLYSSHLLTWVQHTFKDLCKNFITGIFLLPLLTSWYADSDDCVSTVSN